MIQSVCRYVAQEFLAPKALAFVQKSLGSTYNESLGPAATVSLSAGAAFCLFLNGSRQVGGQCQVHFRLWVVQGPPLRRRKRCVQDILLPITAILSASLPWQTTPLTAHARSPSRVTAATVTASVCFSVCKTLV